MNYYALEYETVDDYANRRVPFREAHFQLLRDTQQRGDLKMAGALGDPPNGALLIFQSDTPHVAEQFAHADPYVVNGLVTHWRVRPWHVVAGGDR